MAVGFPSDSTSVSGLLLLVDWANRQDAWVRKLVAEVIGAGRLPDERIEALYNLLLNDVGPKDGTPVSVEPLSAVAEVAATGTTLRLVSLRHIENVNALATNQEIEFHPRLTIVFGENASGKTGYVRILKRAAAVRTAEPVLPNIYASGSGGTPRATIKVRVDGEEQVIEWRGEQGIEPLTRIDVFDARAAVVHLAEDLSYSYTPADLALFPLVADGIERVQAKLQAARDDRQPRTNPFLNRFPRESSLYAKIERLGPSTDLREFETLAQVSAEEEAALPALREKVEALRSGSVRAQLERTERERTALAEALKVAEAVVSFDRDAYREALSTLRTARTKHESATREALVGEDVPGILGEAWKAFIEAAEGYIREMGLDPYPAPGKACVYCRQPLGETAISLLRKYRDYCNAALRQAVEDARTRVWALRARVKDLPLDEAARDVRILMEALEDASHPPPPLAAAREVIEYVRVFQTSLAVEEDCPALPKGLGNVLTILRAGIASAEQAITDLRKQGLEREQALAQELGRLRELEVRLTLRELMPAIRDHVEAARWAERAASYLRSFQSIKRSLTETAKRASAAAMNRDFQRRFEAECRALHAPEVSLDFPGREGEPRRRKLLTPEHGLSEILSEGEQKVVALADFLAEASLKPDRSPIVFDDPVTSLDHKRLEYVVDRLVALSQYRQVVVFTHDIWFAAWLLARFERDPDGCAFYDIRADEGRIGIVVRGSHLRTDELKDRKKRIETLIAEAREASGEVRQHLVEKGYEILRGACETVVEKDLLKEVVERYRPNVRVTALPRIRADRLPAAVQAIQAVFEKCSRVISAHSQPLITLGVRPTLDELQKDWEALVKARNDYLK